MVLLSLARQTLYQGKSLALWTSWSPLHVLVGGCGTGDVASLDRSLSMLQYILC